jgi:hypothetical protein
MIFFEKTQRNDTIQLTNNGFVGQIKRRSVSRIGGGNGLGLQILDCKQANEYPKKGLVHKG